MLCRFFCGSCFCLFVYFCYGSSDLWDAQRSRRYGWKLLIMGPHSSHGQRTTDHQPWANLWCILFVYIHCISQLFSFKKYNSTKIKSVNSLFYWLNLPRFFLFVCFGFFCGLRLWPVLGSDVCSTRSYDFLINLWSKAGERKGTCLSQGILFKCDFYFLSPLHLRKVRADCGPEFRVCFPRNATRV